MRAARGNVLKGEAASIELLRPHVKRREDETGSMWNGFAFEYRLDRDGTVVRLGKEGMNAGVASNLAYYPRIDTTTVVLANQDYDVWSLERELEPLVTTGQGHAGGRRTAFACSPDGRRNPLEAAHAVPREEANEAPPKLAGAPPPQLVGLRARRRRALPRLAPPARLGGRITGEQIEQALRDVAGSAAYASFLSASSSWAR